MSKRNLPSTSESRKPTPPRVETYDPTWSKASIAVVALAIVVAAVLRIWTSLDNFWLDEVWSWMMAQQAKAPLDVFTLLHHDNNHYLNTLVIYQLGNNASFFVYR